MRLAEAFAKRLAIAWRKYVALFGEPPHGTERQLSALLCLLPKSLTKPSTKGKR